MTPAVRKALIEYAASMLETSIVVENFTPTAAAEAIVDLLCPPEPYTDVESIIRAIERLNR